MKQKTTLLHVSSSLKMGGAEAVLCDVIQGLGNEVFEHHVIYFHDGPRREPLEELGVTLHHVRGALCLYDPVFFMRLYRRIKKIKPDCIHSLLWAANVASRIIAKFLSIPHVSAYHIHINVDGRFRKIVDKLTINLSQEFIAVSEEVAESIQPAEPIWVIKNGIDVDGIQKKAQGMVVRRDQLGLAKDQFVIGSVGRFAPRKNFPLLLESFAVLQMVYPEARLVLVGIGPEEQSLKRKAQDLGVADKVVFVVGKHAYGYIPLFDCFVQSSDKEGTSIALLEAMSLNVPCVVVNDGPVHPVIVDGKDGILVQAKGATALAQKISMLIEKRDLAVQLGMAGNKKVRQNFNPEGMVEAYRDIILRVSNRK